MANQQMAFLAGTQYAKTPEQLQRLNEVITTMPEGYQDNPLVRQYIVEGMGGLANRIYRDLTGGQLPSTAELNEMVNYLSNRPQGMGIPQAVSQLQQMGIGIAGREIAKNVSERETQATMQKQVEAEKTFTKGFVEDPTSAWNVLKGQQTADLQTALAHQQDVATQRLINELAARGIGATGGAFAGGSAAINEDIARTLAQGIGQIGQQTTMGIGQEAQQLAQTGTGLTQQQRAGYGQDVAQLMANQYNEQMANQYYQNMQNLANQQQGNIWGTLGTIGGVLAGGFIPGLGALGAVGGGQIGGALGNLLGGRPQQKFTYTGGR